MSDKAAGKKARSPEGCDENGPAAALLLSHVSIQICSFLSPVRLGPPCRRPILIATPLPQSLTWCTRYVRRPALALRISHLTLRHQPTSQKISTPTRLDRYLRAAHYLAGAQIFLRSNALLREP